LFEVPNPDQALMTQMTAQVFFVAASAKDAVLVPLAALRPVASAGTSSGPRGAGVRASGIDPRSQFAKGVALVSVVGADGKVAEREVKVGVMNRVSAQIVSGLEPDEKVVIGIKAPAAAAAPAQTGSALVPGAAKGGGRP
jgi:macrolide-specific efflux system membrane fusion protein